MNPKQPLSKKEKAPKNTAPPRDENYISGTSIKANTIFVSEKNKPHTHTKKRALNTAKSINISKNEILFKQMNEKNKNISFLKAHFELTFLD